MKVASNIGAAHAAVSSFADIKTSARGQHAIVGSSTVTSMHDGARIANAVLTSISDLASLVRRQGGNVTALAAEIENRDRRDATGWGEA